MLSTLLALLLTQVSCAPAESSLVCTCKQGQVTACLTLAGDDANKAAEALEALEVAVEMAQADKDKAQLQPAAEALSQALAAPEPPDCRGQTHHPISRPIHRALREHRTLKGLYTPRDKRFIARAKDEEAHCGYQDWHRKVDKEVIEWLNNNKKATPQEFEAELNRIYNRPEMRERFPRGIERV